MVWYNLNELEVKINFKQFLEQVSLTFLKPLSSVKKTASYSLLMPVQNRLSCCM